MLDREVGVSLKQKKFALVGSPNSGKTTLYNWLTNSNFKTVNYPGATVEFAYGPVNPALGSNQIFIDTPGIYSFLPKSRDEEVAIEALYENKVFGEVDGLILVIDGTQLERHLLIAQQAKETGFPLLLVLTMWDLLQKEKISLSKEILEKEFGAKVVFFDGLLGQGLKEVIAESALLGKTQKAQKVQKWSKEKSETLSARRQVLAQRTWAHCEKKNFRKHTDQVDQFLLHPWLGLVFFFVLMTLLFSSIYWAAAPFMDLIDQSFSWSAAVLLEKFPDQAWADFVSNGILTSFAAVFVFVPQIFILFLGVGVLESSGYLARAATLIDRPLAKIGLSGRSFVPLLSGFACAIPALMATRNLSSKRDRLITQLIIPLMTCSARLPVYALLIGFLFPGNALFAGLTLAALYIGALIVGAVASAILNRMIAKDKSGYFMMELPLYRMPKLSVILTQCLQRTNSYIKRAGPAIFIFAILIWVGTNFPKTENSEQQLQQSYVGQAGHFIEPIFEPMGVDWRVGVGLISAFAAREVFVSSMAVVFQAANDDEATQQESLLSQMRQARNSDGALIFTASSVIGLALFFMIALQCMTTVAMMQKESNSWKLAILQLIAFNLFAYGLAMSVVQGLRFLGVS